MVEFIDTTMRDAHQSLLATRFKTRDLLEIADLIDRVGFYSLEVWGGATFDAAIRFLREDPWDRLKLIREHVRKTKLQMLLRGQNLVGYRHYPDDVVVKFIEYAHRNGIDVFRVFDALNDIRNMEVSIRKAREVGAIVQGAICYTISPVHTIDYYMKLVEELLALEVDMITIKDMAGILDPLTAYELVSRIKKEFKIPVNVHSHMTSGLVVATYLKAVEAGVDYIDTAIAPLAFGTAQPDCRTMYYALPENTRPRIDLETVDRISSRLREIIEKRYVKLVNWRTLIPDPSVLIHQIPGGMISNLIEQLREQNALEKLDEVLKEVPRVREELGYPPLVTPLSQIVGTQAVLNVLFGRYRVVTREVRDYVRGLYGRSPAPINEEVLKKILRGEKPITSRPADLLKPMYSKCRGEVVSRGYYLKEEDVLTYCLFPETAIEFFEARKRGETRLDIGEEIVEEVGEDRKRRTVESVEEVGETSIHGRSIEVVEAPIAGRVLRVLVKPGDRVKKGDRIIVMESMKMETELYSPIDGVVDQVFVREGDDVRIGSKLLTILPR